MGQRWDFGPCLDDRSGCSSPRVLSHLFSQAYPSPRLPPLLVLNEPENSLHPDLLLPLARLILAASEGTQVWVIAHAAALIDSLAEASRCRLLRLEREQGATVLPGQTVLERAAWRWPQE